MAMESSREGHPRYRECLSLRPPYLLGTSPDDALGFHGALFLEHSLLWPVATNQLLKHFMEAGFLAISRLFYAPPGCDAL
jgi:hypothetical protein